MTTWMLVEDEPGLYEVIFSMYALFGVEGIAFTNGEDAIKWIDAVNNGEIEVEKPQLAMLDIRLPGKVGGAQVGARLRQSSVLADMRIVLMTAYHLNSSEETAMIQTAGADVLIYKPLPPMKELKRFLFDMVGRTDY